MGSYLNTIQPAFRLLGFPDFKPQAFQSLVFPFNAAGGGSAIPPAIASQSRYSFVLETNSLAFQTTKYDIFKTFSEKFLDGLKIIHLAIELSFVERIGIRYLDAIQPIKNDALASYLTCEVLGLSDKLSGIVAHSESVTVMNDEVGQLLSRVIITSGKVGFPMDIAATAPKINSRFLEAEGRHAILDTDSSYAQRFAFDIEEVKTRLTAMKSKITQSFDATVTPHAKKVWDQE
jgi:uncharacterized protein (TIGR04255 family)